MVNEMKDSVQWHIFHIQNKPLLTEYITYGRFKIFIKVTYCPVTNVIIHLGACFPWWLLPQMFKVNLIQLQWCQDNKNKCPSATVASLFVPGAGGKKHTQPQSPFLWTPDLAAKIHFIICVCCQRTSGPAESSQVSSTPSAWEHKCRVWSCSSAS